MGPVVVVFPPPVFEEDLGFVEAVEGLELEQFAAQVAVEGFGVRVLLTGAYYSGLTKLVICSPSFRTGTVRNVTQSEKFAVEQEYGMTPAYYGHSLEIDHIVSLELGGSNDIANLFPEKADAHPGYRIKDVLENKLHQLVCAGSMTLHVAQVGIASNWQALYTRVFGKTPNG